MTSKNYFVKKQQIDRLVSWSIPKECNINNNTGKYLDYFPSFVAHSHFDFNQVYFRQESANEW